VIITHLGLPSDVGRLKSLEFASFKVLSLILTGVNFGGLVHIKYKTLALNGAPQVDGRICSLGLVGLWAGYRILKKNSGIKIKKKGH
jgi:hypothetical protein